MNASSKRKWSPDVHPDFCAAYEQHWEELLVYAVKLLNDRDAAMDVVQDVFVDFLQQYETSANIGEIKPYLYGMLRHKVSRVIRKEVQRREYMDSFSQFMNLYEESPERLFVTEELRQLLDRQIQRLPEKMRYVFMLSRQEKLSYKEIASQLNISDKTVKKQINNSLKLLRKIIIEYNLLWFLVPFLLM